LLLKHSIKAVRLASERRAIGARGLFAMTTGLKSGCDLFLQHLGGLVGIVVTDENLHDAFLLDRAVGGLPWTRPGPLAHGNSNPEPMAPPSKNQRRYLKLCLPTGTMAANWKKRRLRYVPVFWAALLTSQYLPV
jgi:hypothetical protein